MTGTEVVGGMILHKCILWLKKIRCKMVIHLTSNTTKTYYNYDRKIYIQFYANWISVV